MTFLFYCNACRRLSPSAELSHHVKHGGCRVRFFFPFNAIILNGLERQHCVAFLNGLLPCQGWMEHGRLKINTGQRPGLEGSFGMEDGVWNT